MLLLKSNVETVTRINVCNSLSPDNAPSSVKFTAELLQILVPDLCTNLNKFRI